MFEQVIYKQGYNLLHQGALAFVDMECQGICVDVPYYQNQSVQLEKKLVKKQEELLDYPEVKQLYDVTGDRFSLNSSVQIEKLIFDICGQERTEDVESTDATSLRNTDLSFVEDLLEWRRLSKTKSTYVDPFIREAVDGRVYGFFNLHIPRSYRSSSDTINWQNIPIRIKEVGNLVRQGIYPDKDHQLIELDFKGNEVRVGNAYHLDPQMTEYNNDSTKDMHRDQGQELFLVLKDQITKDIRFYVKNCFVFPEFYGSWYYECAKNLWKNVVEKGLCLTDGTLVKTHLASIGIKTLKKFISHIQDVEEKFWNEWFPVYNQWKEENWKSYIDNGYVDLKSGFRCQGIMDKKQVNNYPVQGSAFHCLLWCLIWLNKYIKKNDLKSKIIAQIHDSILINLYPSEFVQIVKAAKFFMEEKIVKHYSWLVAPMIAEIEITRRNQPWSMKKEIEV